MVFKNWIRNIQAETYNNTHMLCVLWHYDLWSFQTGGTKLERFLPKNNIHKGNYLILRIGLMGASEVFKNQSYKNQLF